MKKLTLTTSLLLFCALSGFGQNITTSEAAKHVGEHGTVCGMIVSEHTASNSRGEPTFINLDRAYPNQVFTAVIWERDKTSVGAIPSTGRFCVTGLITEYRGAPEIIIHEARDWSLPSADSSPQLSNNRHYTNSGGQSVHSPAYSNSGPPAGATAQCGDGKYSFSQSRRGTCSHHGGVARWL
jgi:hypothetical protein